ncbi:g4100 [Coccomyxa elongata]
MGQSVVGGAASGLDATVSATVQSFETQLATALQQLQTAISAITGQSAPLGGNGQTNLNTFLSMFTSQNPVAAILRTALPPAAAGGR